MPFEDTPTEHPEKVVQPTEQEVASAADAAGDTAVAESVTQIPVTVEQDPERARAMAEAGKTHRYQVVEDRNDAERYRQNPGDWRDREPEELEGRAERNEADELEAQAGRVYDAKSTIDHELEPLSPEDADIAERLRSSTEMRHKDLELAKAKYGDWRALEDKVDASINAVKELDGFTEHLDEEKGYHFKFQEGEESYQAPKAYLVILQKAREEVTEKTRYWADQVLRIDEMTKQRENVAAEHYKNNKGAYYDSALEDMTDQGIPFENNNPNLNQPEQITQPSQA